jgi:3-deoxy-alpha-D-manno-octulosonate 8-oxidase
MIKNLKNVSHILFGRGCFDQLGEILAEKCRGQDYFVLFLVDDVFSQSSLRERLPLHTQDLLLWVNVDDEPKTAYVDELAQRTKDFSGNLPRGVIGIGGGSVMDIAKAVSLMLTNPGSSVDYQGWDLVENPAVYHIGIPTLAGTGAEVSRTTVLNGPQKKLGINSNYTVFDQILLDPELTINVPAEQRFYTGMDCYIHCVESLHGTYINTFARSYGEKALCLCREVFLNGDPDSNDKMMMASYFGGMSIAYSQVGICHALSYGLSFVLGIHHGIGNCMVFNHLDGYYPESVREFRSMMKKHEIILPQNLFADIDEDKLEKMIDVALVLEPLWENVLGADWRRIMTRERVKELYLRM